ncbi:hypothetical protein AAG906_012378 [Vitis piasezkii]
MADPFRFSYLHASPELDRFIPNRSAMDFDFAHYMLTERGKGKENQSVVRSQSKEAYLKLLAETFNMNRSRILAFKNKPPTLVKLIPMNSILLLINPSPQSLCGVFLELDKFRLGQ